MDGNMSDINEPDFLDGEISDTGNPLETLDADAESEVKYRTRLLRGETFYVCLVCGRQYDDEDKAIKHVNNCNLVKEQENGE
jgi:hypothetical protein